MPCRRFRLCCQRTASQQRGMVLLDGVLALLILTAGLAGLATVVLHGLRDSRAAMRTAQAVRLLHDGAEQQRLDPAGTWSAGWQQEIAAVLPDGIGERTPNRLLVAWRDTGGTQTRRLALQLVP